MNSASSATPAEIASYFDRLWSLPRSITGDGVRKTHDILGEILPLERIEIPSGTKCFDWTVPKEWAVREAYVMSPKGERLFDFAENNLHLLNYSAPFRGKMSLRELDGHLYSLPEMPDAIPYRTSYYEEKWGFCLSQNQRDTLVDGEYEVVVDTELIDGSLTISECVLPGETKDEVLISTYTCHPSMANNELSGPLVAAFLGRFLASLPKRRLTYRFVFLPETIGSIAYLHRCGGHLKDHLAAGYVVTCVGDCGNFTYKRSRRGGTLADRACEYLLSQTDKSFSVRDFAPFGSDERQYCSPGFDLPVGALMRSAPGDYPQYHTSLDNREAVSFEAMAESVDLYTRLCLTLDGNRRYLNQVMFGEPQLGKYGLYPGTGGQNATIPDTADILWLLSLADGNNDLIAIAEKSGVDFDVLASIAERCLEAGLLKEEPPAP